MQLSSKYIVGVTGGIGCGKTTVTNLFATHGIQIIDADVVAREVVEPNSAGLNALVAAFSRKILLPNGALDRSMLRELVFADTHVKHQVNGILHPLIRERMFTQLISTRSIYCMLSAPLLFENNLQQYVNRSLVIDITPAQQLERTLHRDGGNSTTIKNIIASQISRKERLALANDVIDNSSTLDSLAPQVNKLHQQYLALANDAKV